MIEAIRRSGADVVFVCLGAPKQEKWMAENGAATGARLLCGLGGSLDVFAGRGGAGAEVLVRPRAGVVLPPVQGAPAHRPHDEAAAVF